MRRLPEWEQKQHLRTLYSTDLYALLRYGLRREDVDHPWLFDRCREVQRGMDGYLDLWAREHYKSTIITFAGLIFRIINNPEITIGIFSHTKPIAKAFLKQIKLELEDNEHLRKVFDDVFWWNPKRESPKWTENEGIVVKRKGNPKECTIEAHGLVDGQPTSKHFGHLHYDDVVTKESVGTPEMMQKTTEAFELSDNLGTEGGSYSIIGTIYNYGDTYMQMRKRGVGKPRIYPCTHDGTEDFSPDNCVLMAPETLKAKRIKQGPITFGNQMRLDPKGDAAGSFKREWIMYFTNEIEPENTDKLNKYILCDPAGEKRKMNDWTSFWVVGLGPDNNYYGLDFIRDRMNLTERTNMLFWLHQLWKPKAVGYEKYGKDSDISHIETEMEHRQYRFPIKALGGITSKPDRIKRLIPVFEQKRMWIRRTKTYTNYEGTTANIIEYFVENELLAFPVMEYDDALDCLARIVDPEFQQLLQWPALQLARPPEVITSTSQDGHRVHPASVGRRGGNRPRVLTGR